MNSSKQTANRNILVMAYLSFAVNDCVLSKKRTVLFKLPTTILHSKSLTEKFDQDTTRKSMLTFCFDESFAININVMICE